MARLGRACRSLAMLVAARQARPGVACLGWARPVQAGKVTRVCAGRGVGEAGQAGHGLARPVGACPGPARHCSARQSRHGKAGKAVRGSARRTLALRVTAGQGCLGTARRGLALRILARLCEAGVAWRGKARLRPSEQGVAWQGRLGCSWRGAYGAARQGSAWQAGRGWAGPGHA